MPRRKRAELPPATTEMSHGRKTSDGTWFSCEFNADCEVQIGNEYVSVKALREIVAHLDHCQLARKRPRIRAKA